MQNPLTGHASRIALVLAALTAAPAAMAQALPTLPPEQTDQMPQTLPSQVQSVDGLEAMRQSVRYCSGQTDRNARLACYDGIGSSVEAQVGARSQQEFAWGVQSGRDRNNRPFATIAMDAVASGSVRDASGADHGRITLTIRCRANAMAAYVTFDRKVAQDNARTTQVLLVQGQQPPVLANWEVSQTGESVGMWRDQSAIQSMLSQMLGAPVLRITVGDGTRDQMSASFKMDGYPAALGKVREACNW